MSGKLWTCWTNNCRSKLDTGLYIIHAAQDGDLGNRTLCGIKYQEFGNPIDEEYQPSCKKCRHCMSHLKEVQKAKAKKKAKTNEDFSVHAEPVV